MTPIAQVLRIASDDRARFDECGASVTLDVLNDDVRAAAAQLSFALSPDSPRAEQAVDFARELLAALDNLPDAEVATCPGRLIVIEASMWHGQLVETVRCDVCGRQVSD